MRSVLSASVLACSLCAIACSGEKQAPVVVWACDGPVHSVTVNPTSVTMETGAVFTLTAFVEVCARIDRGVVWSTSDQSVARVDSTGAVTGASAGAATILATARADRNVRAAATITVVAPVGSRLARSRVSGRDHVRLSSFGA